MKYTKVICAAVLGLSSAIVNAQCSANGCYGVHIDRLNPSKNGTVYVGTSGDEKLTACTADVNQYLRLDLTTIGGEVIFTTLLTAQTTNKLVDIRTEQTPLGCNIVYVILDRQ